MKSLGIIALLLLASVPGWSATKKITVDELKTMLAQMHANKADDDAVATALKQVQMSEELTRTVMNTLADELPGKLSLEQIYVLEARSATLPPPAADLPATPAPDAATQQAMLTKASDYASRTYGQMPSLAAVKTTLRFQDNIEALADASGMHGAAQDASMGTGLGAKQQNYIRFMNSADTPITIERGEEHLPVDKIQWGRNKMIQVQDPDPDVASVMQEATGSEPLKFVRWESINGKAAAVFSYAVNKKKSHMGVHVCCFPDIDQTGMVSFSSSSTGSLNGGGGGGAKGNFQTNTNWNPYKKDNVPYHGELYIDPDTGIVVRMVVQTEEKNTDNVHQLDTRVDYGPVTVGDKPLVLPVKTVTITEVVVNGQAGAGGFSTRTTLFTSEYKNYQAEK